MANQKHQYCYISHYIRSFYATIITRWIHSVPQEINDVCAMHGCHKRSCLCVLFYTQSAYELSNLFLHTELQFSLIFFSLYRTFFSYFDFVLLRTSHLSLQKMVQSGKRRWVMAQQKQTGVMQQQDVLTDITYYVCWSS